VSAGKGTDLGGQIHALAERLPRRSLVILISDLWTEPAELVKALQHLRYRKHQAMILHLLDRSEMDLTGGPFEKQVTLEDLETGEKMQVDPAELRETYRREVERYLGEIRRGTSDCDVEYHAIYIDRPYERALVDLLTRRA
jgi:uncharacterized protein (DUF58 family)